jgi:adenosylhomocysteinase
MSAERYEARQNVEGFVLPDGRTLFLLAEGRLVNLASGDGHPAEIMDMSFAVQALSARYLAENRGHLKPGLLAVPREIDEAVALAKLKTLGLAIDRLSEAQRGYLSGV